MYSEDVVHGFFIHEVIIMIFCFPSSFIFSRKVVPSSQIFTFLKANFLVSNDIKKVNHLSPHFFTFCQSFEAPLFIFPFPFTIIIPSIVYVLKNSSLAKLSSHSSLSDISISQSRSKLQFKPTNHIQVAKLLFFLFLCTACCTLFYSFYYHFKYFLIFFY